MTEKEIAASAVTVALRTEVTRPGEESEVSLRVTGGKLTEKGLLFDGTEISRPPITVLRPPMRLDFFAPGEVLVGTGTGDIAFQFTPLSSDWTEDRITLRYTLSQGGFTETVHLQITIKSKEQDRYEQNS